MKIIFGEEVKTLKLCDLFVIEVEIVHGDADHYETCEINIPENRKDLLERAIKILNEMSEITHHNARDYYEELIEFQILFGSEYLGYDKNSNWPKEITENEYDELTGYFFEWPNDVTYNDVYATLDNYKIFYYDSSGRKLKVSVEI